MDRHALAALILKIDGILLLVVATIHLAATPLALNFVSSQSTPDAYAQIKPPFLLSFVMGGILLIPLGLSTFFCANSVRRGETWARTICRFNAITVLMLPLALVLTMPSKYFHAIPFLVAAILVCIVAISMSAPLALSRVNPLSSTIPPQRPPA
jgi:peptidoglycan/LPS O-acetylase OafA/YrhL